MSDETPELLPFADLVDKLRHLANGGAGPVNEICAKAADAIQAYRLTVGDLLDQKLAAAITRPTPAERPVPQVREALAHQEEIARIIRCTVMGSTETTSGVSGEYDAARAILALTARPSDAAVAVQDTWFADSTLPIMGMEDIACEYSGVFGSPPRVCVNKDQCHRVGQCYYKKSP